MYIYSIGNQINLDLSVSLFLSAEKKKKGIFSGKKMSTKKNMSSSEDLADDSKFIRYLIGVYRGGVRGKGAGWRY